MAKEKDLKEKCSSCGSLQFTIAHSHLAQRQCSKCRAVWLPKSIEAIHLDNAKDEIATLRGENFELKKENESLREFKAEIDRKREEIKNAKIFE